MILHEIPMCVFSRSKGQELLSKMHLIYILCLSIVYASKVIQGKVKLLGVCRKGALLPRNKCIAGLECEMTEISPLVGYCKGTNGTECYDRSECLGGYLCTDLKCHVPKNPTGTYCLNRTWCLPGYECRDKGCVKETVLEKEPKDTE